MRSHEREDGSGRHVGGACGAGRVQPGGKGQRFVFVSGQLGIDPTTGELAGDTAGEQTAQALKNIKQILDTAGTGIEHVVRATIYMKNVEDFKEVDARYADVFIGSVKPARVPSAATTSPRAPSSRSTPSQFCDGSRGIRTVTRLQPKP